MAKLICKVTSCKNYDHDIENCSFDELTVGLHNGYSANIVHCSAYEDVSPKCKRCKWGHPLETGHRAECILNGKIQSMDYSCDKYEPEEGDSE